MPRTAASASSVKSDSGTPPVGVTIGGRNQTYRIGKRIGMGACASVHLVEGAPGFVVKVAPLPTKKTRKGDSPAETNAQILDYETTMYRVQFMALQGSVIPRLPSNKEMAVPCGDVEGFRYLMMERMECPLSDAIKMMRKQGQRQTSIRFGVLAVRMLECVKAIHEEKHVIVDIKTENFMLASGGDVKGASKKSKTSDFEADLASRIRILDLALVLPYRTIASHRDDDGTGSQNGTPLYRSLFMHKGSTPSRRDDLESLAYVIAELLIDYHRSDDGNSEHCLPWSKGKSDEEIGKIKEEQVNDTQSELYHSLGDKSVAKAFSTYLDEIRRYKFKQTPDYESLSKSLMGIRLTAKGSPSSSKKQAITTPLSARKQTVAPSPVKKTVPIASPAPVSAAKRIAKRTADDPSATPGRRVTRSRVAAERATRAIRSNAVDLAHNSESDDESSVCLVSPPKVHKANEAYDVDKYDHLDESQDSVATIFTDAQQTHYTDALEHHHHNANDEASDGSRAVPMDYAIVGDENDEPDENGFADAVADMNVDSTEAIKPKPYAGVRLKHVSGPKANDIVLVKGKFDKVSVGAKPAASKAYQQVSLKGDDDITTNHIKLDLDIKKRMTFVKVTRHKSGGYVQVRDHDLKAGSDTRAFVGDTITIGQTKFVVAKL